MSASLTSSGSLIAEGGRREESRLCMGLPRPWRQLHGPAAIRRGGPLARESRSAPRPDPVHGRADPADREIGHFVQHHEEEQSLVVSLADLYWIIGYVFFSLHLFTAIRLVRRDQVHKLQWSLLPPG